MDILLYKDGHLTISESPLQGKENNLDDAVMLISNPQEGDTLTYKSGKWINGEGGGGGFAPDITNPQDGDTLVYNATAGKWVNGSGGGGGLVVHANFDQSTQRVELDKTWKEINDTLSAGGSVSVDSSMDGYTSMVVTMVSGSDYKVVVRLPADSIGNLGDLVFTAGSQDDYPGASGPEG